MQRRRWWRRLQAARTCPRVARLGADSAGGEAGRLSARRMAPSPSPRLAPRPGCLRVRAPPGPASSRRVAASRLCQPCRPGRPAPNEDCAGRGGRAGLGQRPCWEAGPEAEETPPRGRARCSGTFFARRFTTPAGGPGRPAAANQERRFQLLRQPRPRAGRTGPGSHPGAAAASPDSGWRSARMLYTRQAHRSDQAGSAHTVKAQALLILFGRARTGVWSTVLVS